MFRRIICPTDFSPTSLHAAKYAADLARSCGAELVLLHVVAEMTYPMRSLGTVTAFPHLQEELHKRAAEELEEVRKKLATGGVTIRGEMRDGEVYQQILDSAKANGAELIVIGTHGHTGIKHMLLGSTAEKVVRLSDVPVLTVRKK